MLGAVVFGHEQGNIAIAAINELVRDAGKPEWDWTGRRPRTRPSSPRSTRWPKSRCARPTRSAASRPARRPAARPTPTCMAALKAEGVEFDNVKVEAHAVRHRSAHRAQPDPGRRAAHRRPRHAHRAPDRDPQRRAAAHPRLGAVHARRDAGAGGGHAGHRPRRAAHRRAGRRVHRQLHAALQHAALRHRRNRPRRQPEAPRDRPRPPGQARAARRAAEQGRLPVHDARGLRDHRIATARRRWPRCAAAAWR